MLLLLHLHLYTKPPSSKGLGGFCTGLRAREVQQRSTKEEFIAAEMAIVDYDYDYDYDYDSL